MNLDGGGLAREIDFLKNEPLGEAGRRQRRSLLAASTLGLVLAIVGVVPKEITSFGVKLLFENPGLLPIPVAFINVYFLVAFGLYAHQDFLAWKEVSFKQFAHMAKTEREDARGETPVDVWENYVPGTTRWNEVCQGLPRKHRLWKAYQLYWLRALFDFYGPLGYGLLAIALQVVFQPLYPLVTL